MRGRRATPTLSSALLGPAVIVLALMLLPVLVVVAIALGPSPDYQFPPQGVTLHWFQSFLSNPIFADSLFRISLPLALTVSLVATGLGTLAAVGLARSSLRGRRIVEGLFFAPVIFPQILLGVGLFLLYAQLGVTPTLTTLALGHVLIGTPYVIRTVLAGLSGIDPGLEQAARNLGAHPVRAFWLITVPMLRPSILSGAIFAFIVSFSDINLVLFLSVADTATLPMQILSQMQYANDPTIAAAATVQVLVISALVLVVQRLAGPVRLR